MGQNDDVMASAAGLQSTELTETRVRGKQQRSQKTAPQHLTMRQATLGLADAGR